MSLVAIKIKSGKMFDFYAIEQNSQCGLLDFLTEISRSNPVEFNKLIKDIDRTADNGLIRNTEKFKTLDNGIHEFKTYGGIRVLCFFDGRRIIVLTNGFMKRKKYEPEITRAINLRAKYIESKNSNSLAYKEEII